MQKAADDEHENPDIGGEEDDEEIELPAAIMKRVEALRKLHDDVGTIDEEYKLERIALEAKFREKRSVVYEKRKNIISGEVDVEDNDKEVEDVDAEKGIPNFWLQAFGNHPVIADIINEHDIPALSFLEDVRCTYNEDYTTFTLSFEFKENPFFNNKILTKTYTLTPYLLDEKNPSLSDSEGTVIDWKAGKNLCIAEIKKKQKAKTGKNKGQIRVITKEVPQPSFFQYFGEPKSEDEEDEEENEDGEEKERIQLTEEEDFEVAHAIRTAIIPDALLWFTGEAQYDEYDEGDMEDGDEEDDEEGPDGDDDEDDDDDEEATGGDKKGKTLLTKTVTGGFASAPSSGNAPGSGEQPECKQN